MVEDVGFLLSLGIISGVALLLGLLFARLRTSVIAAEILAGMLVGPYVLGWISDVSVISDFASVGIVVLLFLIGLELDPVKFLRMIRRAGSLALVEMGLTFIVGLACARFLGLDLSETLVFAMAASATSTAIVGQFLLSRGMRDQTSRLLIGILVIEDIVAVVFLIVISSLPAGGIITARTGLLAISETILGGFALLTIGVVVARYVAPPAINFLSHYEEEFEELPFFFAIGLGFAFGVLGAYLGYSAGVGAFIIGLAMRGKHSKYLSGKVAPIKGLLVFIFFVYMGTQIDPFPALQIWPAFALVVVLLIAAKYAGGVLIGRIMGARDPIGETDPRMVGAWLVPRGEFSFIIGQAALAAGLIDTSTFSILGVMVLVTAMAGPLLQKLGRNESSPSQHPLKPARDG
jgi:Kef-type K+ transport system membrane component KefB